MRNYPNFATVDAGARFAKAMVVIPTASAMAHGTYLWTSAFREWPSSSIANPPIAKRIPAIAPV